LTNIKAFQSRATLYYSFNTDSCDPDTPANRQLLKLKEMEADAAERGV
jgi:hypothetical protein